MHGIWERQIFSSWKCSKWRNHLRKSRSNQKSLVQLLFLENTNLFIARQFTGGLWKLIYLTLMVWPSFFDVLADVWTDDWWYVNIQRIERVKPTSQSNKKLHYIIYRERLHTAVECYTLTVVLSEDISIPPTTQGPNESCWWWVVIRHMYVWCHKKQIHRNPHHLHGISSVTNIAN